MNRNVTPCAWSARTRSNSRAMAAPSSWAVGSSRMMNRAPNDERPGDLHELTLLDAERGGRLVDVDVDRPGRQQRSGLPGAALAR